MIKFERGKERPIFCPLCGKMMSADLHGPEEEWKNKEAPEGITFEERLTWDCWSCDDCNFFLDRSDIDKIFWPIRDRDEKG